MRLIPFMALLISIEILACYPTPTIARSTKTEKAKEQETLETTINIPLCASIRHTGKIQHHKAQKKNHFKTEPKVDISKVFSTTNNGQSDSSNGFLSDLPFSFGSKHNSAKHRSVNNAPNVSNKSNSIEPESKKQNEVQNTDFLSFLSPFNWFRHRDNAAAGDANNTSGANNAYNASKADNASNPSDPDHSNKIAQFDEFEIHKPRTSNDQKVAEKNLGTRNSDTHNEGDSKGSRRRDSRHRSVIPGTPNASGTIPYFGTLPGFPAPGGIKNSNNSDTPGGTDGSNNPDTSGGAKNPNDPNTISDAGNSNKQNVTAPVSTSFSFADLHKQQLRRAPLTARNEAMTRVTAVDFMQTPRTHQDWGSIGGMTPGGLNMTEPPSPNNLKTPIPNQFVAPAQIKDYVTAYGDTSPAGFHTEIGPPNRPFWFTQPNVVGPIDSPQSWTGLTMRGLPKTDFYEGMGAAMGSMITAETNSVVNYDSTQAKTQAETQQFGDATNAASQSNLQTGMNSAVKSLINIANENTSGPYGRAIQMVQAMWKTTFLPFAILLVLPGALLTQMKGLVKTGLINDSNDEDGANPFMGILRAMIAIFLIPATQLIVSYAIDIGNSMTEVVTQQVQLQSVTDWAAAQTTRPQGATPAEQAKLDAEQSGKDAFKRASFGFINSLFTNALVILLAYQTVMICYLFLLGPIAAALFAWPSTTNTLFKNVFSNWINGLISLVLWRFWWSLIILCMSIRIQWLKDLHEYNPNSPWEGVVYSAFVVMLTYVPFMPFEFKPGAMVTSLLAKASAGGSDGSAATSGDPNAAGAQPPATHA